MNKKNAQKIKLETKLCISTNSRCVLCHRLNKHTVGMAETYSAGTDDWVCYDCAFGIDPELAESAYYPERYQRLDHTPFQDDPWGVCPECGRPYDQSWNAGAYEWVVCLRHGFRWCVGEHPPSGWKEDPEYLHQANEFLNRLREVDPWHGQIDLVRDLIALRQVAVNAGNTTLVAMTDHASFTRVSAELEAVWQLHIQEFPDDELVNSRSVPRARHWWRRTA